MNDFVLLGIACLFTFVDSLKSDAYYAALLQHITLPWSSTVEHAIGTIIAANDVCAALCQAVLIGCIESRVTPIAWCFANLTITPIAWLAFPAPSPITPVRIAVLFVLRSINVRYSMVVKVLGAKRYAEMTVLVQCAVAVLPQLLKLPVYYWFRWFVFDGIAYLCVAGSCTIVLVWFALATMARYSSLERQSRRGSSGNGGNGDGGDRRRPIRTCQHHNSRSRFNDLSFPCFTTPSNPSPTPSTHSGPVLLSPLSLSHQLPLVPSSLPPSPPLPPAPPLPFTATPLATLVFSPNQSSCTSPTPAVHRAKSVKSRYLFALHPTWFCNLSCILFLAAVYHDYAMFAAYANQRLGFDLTYDVAFVYAYIHVTVLVVNILLLLRRVVCSAWSLSSSVSLCISDGLIGIAFGVLFFGRLLFLWLQLEEHGIAASITSHDHDRDRDDQPRLLLLILVAISSGAAGNLQPLLAERMFHDRAMVYEYEREHDHQQTRDNDECVSPFDPQSRHPRRSPRHQQLFKWLYLDGRHLVNAVMLLVASILPIYLTANTIALIVCSAVAFVVYRCKTPPTIDSMVVE